MNTELQRQAWDREYRDLRVIPSSTRDTPSKALLLYETLLDYASLSPVLDAGCGNGRNAIYLAARGCQVDAVDYSGEALSLLSGRADAADVNHRIRVIRKTLSGRWDLADDHYQFLLDSYVSCHLLAESERSTYLREMLRVLRPGGVVYSSAFSLDDEYYSKLMEGHGGTSREVVDPRNGIAKYLYSEDEFQQSYSGCFNVIYSAKFHFDDIVLGSRFRRSVLTLIAEKAKK